MSSIDPARKRKALLGLLWFILICTALALFMVWTDRKHPTGWHQPDPAQEKARELLEENYRENIRPHVTR